MLVAFEEAGTKPSAPTDRELEITAALAGGAGKKQIAQTYGISKEATGNRVYDIHAKFGPSSTPSARAS